MGTAERDALFQEIYEDYYDKVLSFIRARVNVQQDAEDLTSDVFLKCYKNIEKYDPERAAVSTWIFTIANNTLKNHYRDSRQMTSIDDMEGYDVPYEEDFDKAIRLEEIRRYLDEAIADFAARERRFGKTSEQVQGGA